MDVNEYFTFVTDVSKKDDRIKKINERIERHKKNLISEDSEGGRYIHRFEIDRMTMRSFEDGRRDRFYVGSFTFKKGINLLFGGNGHGKSSLIEFLSAFKEIGNAGLRNYNDLIMDNCKMYKNEGDAKIYSFCNSKNNERYNFNPETAFSFYRHMQSKERSEGQSVMQSVSDFLYFINDDKYVPVDEDTVVFVDEIDSGLDAVACRYLVNRIKKILKRKPRLQMFLAFNQYEMCKLDTQWLNVCTGKFEDCPKTYEEYFERLNKNKREHKRRIDTEVRK